MGGVQAVPAAVRLHPFHQKVLTVHHLLLTLTITPSPAAHPDAAARHVRGPGDAGSWGFVITAFFVMATALLIVDMVRRIRRVRYRAQVEEERMAAAAEADIEAEEARTSSRLRRAARDTNGNGSARASSAAPGIGAPATDP